MTGAPALPGRRNGFSHSKVQWPWRMPWPPLSGCGEELAPAPILSTSFWATYEAVTRL
jgi:hypothetical protein